MRGKGKEEGVALREISRGEGRMARKPETLRFVSLFSLFLRVTQVTLVSESVSERKEVTSRDATHLKN